MRITKYDSLPFRPGVGMMIINKENKIFVGRRINTKANGWQMPQGGIDIGETPSMAAMREMEEEIGTGKGMVIAESKNWYSYRIPNGLIPRIWGGEFCGQKQKWFLIQFDGRDDDINIETEIPEFEEWKWISVENLLEGVVSFKVSLYTQVINEFKLIIDSR